MFPAWEVVQFIFKEDREIRNESHVAWVTSLAFGSALCMLGL